MKNVVLKFGIISGIIVSVLMGISFMFMDQLRQSGSAEIVGFAGIFVGLSLIFFAVKSYRDNYNGGRVSFGKAFLIGLYITLIASAVHTTLWMIYYSAGPGKEVMTEYFNAEVEKVRNSDKTQEEKDAELAEGKKWMEMYSNPAIMAAITFVTEVPSIGLPMSLLCALTLMRKEPR